MRNEDAVPFLLIKIMAKYIDADNLKRAIVKLSENEYNDGTIDDDVANGALDYVIVIINRLQQEQKDVGLENEIEEHSERMPMSEFTIDSEAEEFVKWAKQEFRHFYELGLKSRK